MKSSPIEWWRAMGSNLGNHQPMLMDARETSLHPNRPRFDPTVNLGHILTFIGFMATGFGVYSHFDKRLSVVEVKTEIQAQRSTEYEARIKESLQEIKSDVKDMKRSVDGFAASRSAR